MLRLKFRMSEYPPILTFFSLSKYILLRNNLSKIIFFELSAFNP